MFTSKSSPSFLQSAGGFIAAIAMVSALAGCSGGLGDNSASGSGALTEADSPLNEYLAAVWGTELSPEEQSNREREDRRQVENLVAACMSAAGFEYVPNVESEESVVSDAAYAWEPEKREWVEKYGYGVVNSPDAELRRKQSEQDAPTDPNEKIVAALSASELAAYEDNLYGVAETEEDPGDGSASGTGQGCRAEAENEIQGEDVWQSDDFAEIRTKIQELNNEVLEDSALADVNAKWAECMADAGEPGFAHQADAQGSIVEAYNALYEDESAAFAETEAAQAGEFFDPSQSSQMQALGDQERELALIDLDCRDKTAFVQESLKARFAREEKFIADNRAELDALKTAAEQSK